ncbi:hypothetical protein [Streptomyces mangrovisoli]|uniref:hypothetical protein n=1 Tax=Streptomyces mangrovisoli TaxID=1428628 RepID=UPI001160AE63|nr:hypothetical protein [Streptomyces mangrovisoli]
MNRPDAGPLAVAIARAVEESEGFSARWHSDRRAVLLGAVLGAYLSLSALSDPSGSHPDVLLAATSGAVAGALGASASAFVLRNIEQIPPDDYLAMGDG